MGMASVIVDGVGDVATVIIVGVVMARIVIVGVDARHTNGGSDSPRQVEDAAALAAASLAVVVL